MTTVDLFDSVNRLTREHKRMPTHQEIADDLKQDPAHIAAVIKVLRTNMQNIKTPDDWPEEDKAQMATPQKESSSWQLSMIRWSMGIFGVITAVVAGYFVVAGLIEWMPPGVAVPLGISITGFTVTCFELVIFIWGKRGFWKKAAAVFFAVLWTITELFTFKSSVAGFYGYYAQTRQVASTQTSQSAEKSRLEADVKDLEAQNKILAGNIERDQKIASLASKSLEEKAKNQVSFSAAIDRIQADSNLMRANTAEITRKRAALTALPVVVETHRIQGFEDWISGLLGWDAELLKLIEAILPSLFIDLIASIGLAVALFLKGSSTENPKLKRRWWCFWARSDR